MTTDRELLELAAKAAGKKYAKWDDFFGCFSITGDNGVKDCPWNPLSHSYEAFDLSVKLRLAIDHGNELDNDRYVHVSRHGIEMVRSPVSVFEEIEDEAHREAATRRAIVRAAAEIGKESV